LGFSTGVLALVESEFCFIAMTSALGSIGFVLATRAFFFEINSGEDLMGPGILVAIIVLALVSSIVQMTRSKELSKPEEERASPQQESLYQDLA